MRMALLMISILVMASSCSRRLSGTSSEVKDSTVTNVTTIQRDTLVRLGSDSVHAALSLELPGLHHEPGAAPVEVTDRSRFARITLTRKGNTVTGKCICDSLQALVKLQDKIIASQRSRVETITKTVREQFIPRFTLYMSYLGWASLILLVIYLVIKILKINIL